jgi:hypothetical protein
MLVYLDALIDALRMRDGAEVTRLLAHPLARLLPEDVRLEATSFVDGARDALAAPLRTMQLRHQTAELLREAPIADCPEAVSETAIETAHEDSHRHPPPPSLTRRGTRPQQMELPLSA